MSPLRTAQAIAALALGPSFSAHRNGTDQTVSASTYTKVQHTTEAFDTAGAFDNATNFRFTPLTAGKYLVIAQVKFLAIGDGEQIISVIYKNGSEVNSTLMKSAGAGGTAACCTAIIDMNGSTDYLEHFGWQNNSGTKDIDGGSNETFFMAARIG